MKYFDPSHPDAFVDYPGKMDKPIRYPAYCLECPKCFGYGGWNLALNCYPLHGKENTPENRHIYAHFRANCSQCNGWGWVDEKNAQCIHDLKWVKNTGKCLNLYRCTRCGKEEEWDSSD